MAKNGLGDGFWSGADVEGKFWERVRKGDGPDDCWEWDGAKSRQGYAVLHVSIRVHRYAYALLKGAFPEELDILHQCDNPGCVNPAHLRPGTALENRQDCVLRGRTAKGDRSARRLYPERFAKLLESIQGERNANAKITEQQALEIRRRYAAGGVSQSQLAKEYGMRQSAISRIVNGSRWKHLPKP